MEEVLKEQIKNDIAKIVKILKEIDLNLKDNVALNEKNVEIHINPDCKLEDGKWEYICFVIDIKIKKCF